ncbi:hypothetical protein HaLaN_20387 [Haematococcus lacustris]|uniref:Uncharacterized protein n=1 Tax=Haematococcus lacustris TaxID=44745 RepID=A0A699ZLF6_HAELA|nr:hypothetical protein HaLaN_20387 [Haematococcus lacustris]
MARGTRNVGDDEWRRRRPKCRQAVHPPPLTMVSPHPLSSSWRQGVMGQLGQEPLSSTSAALMVLKSTMAYMEHCTDRQDLCIDKGESAAAAKRRRKGSSLAHVLLAPG